MVPNCIDRTGRTVELFEDINPAGDSSPSGYTFYDDLLYFAAEGPSGNELYRTDGNSVTLVADIHPSGRFEPLGIDCF